MNVEEWTKDVSIEDVITRCVSHIMPQIDANYVDRYLSRRPVPALQAGGLIQLGIAMLQRLPWERRVDIDEEFRRTLYVATREALDASVKGDVVVPGQGAFRRKDPFRDNVAEALYLRWAPFYIALKIALSIPRDQYPVGIVRDGTV